MWSPLKNSEKARSVSTYPVHENATAIEPPLPFVLHGQAGVPREGIAKKITSPHFAVDSLFGVSQIGDGRA